METSDLTPFIYLDITKGMDNPSATMIVSKNLERLMVAKDMTPASLAREAGLNPTGIHDILRQRSKSPKIATVEKIATALNVPVHSLFMEPSEFEDSEIISLLFSRLDDASRKQLIVTARAWASAVREASEVSTS